MLKDLETYIHQHRKKGFSHDEIGHFLVRHGWHHSHIQAAITSIKHKENQRFITGSIWYLLILVVVTVGIIQVGQLTGSATLSEIACVADFSGLGNWNLVSSQKTCCTTVKQSRCIALDKPELLKDPSGRAFFKGDYSCVGAAGRLLINEAGLVHCQ